MKHTSSRAALLLASAALVACGGGDDSGNESNKADLGVPLYAIATAVSDDNGANTYVKVFSAFEAELDLGSAREFPGWSDIGVIGRYVFVSSGEGPTVWRFTIDDGGDLVDDGVIDFGLYVGDANFYNQTLVSETKAYLIGEGEYVVWNPSTLEITGTIPFPELSEREGIPAYFGLDRSATLRDGRLYATVTWADVDELLMLPDSRIVVIDTEVDEVVDVLDVPCPDVSIADRDEAGNLYFSNWVYSPGATLLMEGPSTCAVRIPAGSEVLDDWSLPYGDATGHEGATLGYLGEGKWVFSSFLNDPENYDPNEDWFDWLFGNHWELRSLDPDTMTTTPVEGAPKNGGGYYASRVDGMTYLLLPGDSYTTTTAYAVGADGVAEQMMHMNGWSTRLFRAR